MSTSLEALDAIVDHMFGGLTETSDRLQEIMELASVADHDHEALIIELSATWRRLTRGLANLAVFHRAAKALIEMAKNGDGELFTDPEQAREVARFVLEVLLNPDEHQTPDNKNNRQRDNNNRKINKPRQPSNGQPRNAKKSNGETGSLPFPIRRTTEC